MIETEIYDTLQSLVGGRCYPVLMPQEPTYPALVYSRQASNPQYRLEGGSSLTQARVSIDCYAQTYDAVKSLSAQVRQAMEEASFKGTLIFDTDFYEPDVKLFRILMDFYVWEK
jgi:hypothetical protein